MRVLKNTFEIKAYTEEEAKETIEAYRKKAEENGTKITAAGYTYKSKKAKGEIVDEAYIVKISEEFGTVWED